MILLLIVLTTSLHGALFPGYDFTFFETVSSDSLMSIDEDYLGLDYTGYGFIGGESRTGIYLRIGIQAPYSSLISLFSADKEEPDSEKLQESLEKSFRFSISAGPSFRKFIGDEAIWYMGLGSVFSMDYSDRENALSEMKHTWLEMDFGAEFDIGIRFDVEKTTTLRIGVHGAFTFFSITADILSSRTQMESVTNAVMIPNLFLPEGEQKPFSAEGYISLGHTFRQDWGMKRMKYIITTPEKGSGILLLIDQELPLS